MYVGLTDSFQSATVRAKQSELFCGKTKDFLWLFDTFA